MTRNIFLIDSSFDPISLTPKEFFVIRADADARGLTPAQHVKDVAAEYAARSRRIIVDFPAQ
jgi:hypothetical protein